MSYAAGKGHSEIVKLLLRAGARDIPNKVNLCALDYVSHVPQLWECNIIILQYVVVILMTLSLTTQYGATALLYAGWKGHSEIVKLLRKTGARDTPANKVNWPTDTSTY